MTATLARSTLVSIIAGTTPTKGAVLGLGGAFTLKKSQGPESTARVGRSFYLWETSRTPRGYFVRTRANEYLVELEARVFYSSDIADRDLLDAVIAQDMIDLSDRLLNETLWQRETSGIVLVGAAAVEMLPTRREAVAGGWESILSIGLHHR